MIYYHLQVTESRGGVTRAEFWLVTPVEVLVWTICMYNCTYVGLLYTVSREVLLVFN